MVVRGDVEEVCVLLNVHQTVVQGALQAARVALATVLGVAEMDAGAARAPVMAHAVAVVVVAVIHAQVVAMAVPVVVDVIIHAQAVVVAHVQLGVMAALAHAQVVVLVVMAALAVPTALAHAQVVVLAAMAALAVPTALAHAMAALAVPTALVHAQVNAKVSVKMPALLRVQAGVTGAQHVLGIVIQRAEVVAPRVVDTVVWQPVPEIVVLRVPLEVMA